MLIHSMKMSKLFKCLLVRENKCISCNKKEDNKSKYTTINLPFPKAEDKA